MPSTETRIPTNAERVKAANTQLGLAQQVSVGGGVLSKNPEEQKRLHLATLDTNGHSNPYGA